jgi:hypothetical protein
MLDPESEAWEKRIQARQVDESWKVLRWIVLLIFSVNWCTWFHFIYRHWEQMTKNGSAIGGVALLVFFPFPCVFMFYKRNAYPPPAALFTYILLTMAFGVVAGR